MNYEEKFAKRLAAKVESQNKLGLMMNEWQPKIKAALVPWIGQKVSLVTGGKPVKLKQDLAALGMPDTFDTYIRVEIGTYSVKANCRVAVSAGSYGTVYAEGNIYLGDMEHGTLKLKDLHYDYEQMKTNHTVEGVKAARIAVTLADDALSAAKRGLHPFSTHDND